MSTRVVRAAPALEARSGIRWAAVAAVAGCVTYIVGDNLPVAHVLYTADDPGEAVRRLEAAPGQWAASSLLTALGVLVCAAGIGSLTLRLGDVVQRPGARRAARVAAWGAVLSLAGVVASVWNLFSTAADLVAELGAASAGSPSARLVVVGLLWAVGLLLVVVGLGLTLLLSGLRRLLGWLLLVLGPLAFLAAAFLGQELSYAVVGVAGVVLAIAPPD